MEYIVKCNIVSRDIAGRKMDNEPQGQAGKRVVDSFSLKIATWLYDCMTIVDHDYDDSLGFLYSVHKQR